MTAPEFAMYAGDDALTLALCSLGGSGVVSVASHIVGNELHKMVWQVSITEKREGKDRQMIGKILFWNWTDFYCSKGIALITTPCKFAHNRLLFTWIFWTTTPGWSLLWGTRVWSIGYPSPILQSVQWSFLYVESNPDESCIETIGLERRSTASSTSGKKDSTRRRTKDGFG